VIVATLGQASGAVVLGHGVRPEGALVNTFIAFVAAAAISGVALSRRRGSLSRLDRRLRSEGGVGWSVLMVVATCGAFGGFYVAISLISPVAVSALEAGVGPLLALLIFSRPLRTRASMIAPVLMVLLSILVAWVVLGGRGGTGLVVGLWLTLLVGVSGVLIVLASRRLGESGFSVNDVNVVRFVGAGAVFGLICVVVLVRDGLVPPEGVNVAHSLVFITLPFLLLQYGLVKGDPVRSELVMSSLPALVFFGEALRFSVWNASLGLLMIVSLSVAAAGASLEANKHRSSFNQEEEHL
jgi:drug/metabolite transporter (DMT)-like permease